MSTDRVRAEWRNRVLAEYTSAAHTAQVLHWTIQCGLPDEIHRIAIRIVGDELDHAQLSHQCLVAFGGEDLPTGLDVQRLALSSAAEGPLASLVDAIVSGFCLGETFAVPLFNAMRVHTRHPMASKVLERVLQDEAIHRGFGWDALDALLEIDPQGVRARVKQQLPRNLAQYHGAYGDFPDVEPLTDEERSCGLLDYERYLEIHNVTLQKVIMPWFERRGIKLRDAD